MSATLEEAIEEVRTLPPEEQQQLREMTANFGELLLMALLFLFLNKELDKSTLGEVRASLEKLNREVPQAGLASQRALRASQIRGKYRDVLTSSDEFIARKAAETTKEDRAR